jgi:CubicO group peptidase (beta-lactamase class C family)
MKATRLRHLSLTALFAALFIAPASGWAEPPPSRGEKAIAARLQPFVDHHTLAGAVILVASKDKVLDVETVGYADVEAKKPMKADSLFWIASQSKSITAAALMLLVDENRVKLDDPVEKYLPEFRNQWVAVYQESDTVLLRKPKHPITVRNLLSHTSGMPFRSAMEEPTLDMLTLRDAVRSYAMTPLQSEPGSKYQYSNAGINTAGRIIEVVSGMSYEDFLDKRLLQPLGMKDTTYWPSEAQLERLAKSYRPNGAKDDLEEFPISQLKYPLNDRKRQPMPAGGLFSTADDVGRFCRMMLAGGEFEGKRILSEEAVKEMTSKQTGKLPDGYGLGFSVENRPGGGFGHGGAHSTNMWVDRDKGLVMVLLMQHAGFPNTDGGKIHPTFQQAAREAFGK